MMTVKASVALMVAYVLALAAGTTSGLLADRLRAGGPASATAPLAVQLQLSNDQVAKMRDVWEGVSQNVDSCLQEAQKIQTSRDEVLLNLLTDEQKAKFATMDKG